MEEDFKKHNIIITHYFKNIHIISITKGNTLK